MQRNEKVLISIHAPREGCDHRAANILRHMIDISIHAPREGCDAHNIVNIHNTSQFQSTHPVRGATTYLRSVYNRWVFQSTHPVRGATQSADTFQHNVPISIHAPREGCDDIYHHYLRNEYISIHAPREGCDCKNGLHISKYGYSTHSTASIVPYDSPAFSPICESAESICQQITHS